MFKCECGFTTDRCGLMDTHRMTKQHDRNMVSLKKKLKDSQNENGNFVCADCEYSTIYKCNYRKHIISRKHKDAMRNTEKKVDPVSLLDVMDMFLKFHANATEKQQTIHANATEKQQTIHANTTEKQHIQTTEMFKALADRIAAHEQQQQLVPTHNQQTEILKTFADHIANAANQNVQNSFISTTGQNNLVGNTMQKFNLNLFLNEECKNAMNMNDFIQGVVVTMEDLENLGEMGYTEGMSKILTKAIRSKETSERPMHCTDVKRETIYVRKDDAWKKDDDCEETKRLIQHITKKNYKALTEWRRDHPEHTEPDTADYEAWYSISRNMCNTDPAALKKLIRHLALTTAVEKNQLVST